MKAMYACRRIKLGNYSVEYKEYDGGVGFFIQDKSHEFYVSLDTMLLVKKAIEDHTKILWFGYDGLIFCRLDDKSGLHWVWNSGQSQITSPQDTNYLLTWLNVMEDIWTNH